MTQNDNEAFGSDYKVDVNPDVAFTITYDDKMGRLLFCIEVGNDPKTIFLNRHPSANGQMVDMHNDIAKARVALAIERIKTYFGDRGLTVELD